MSVRRSLDFAKGFISGMMILALLMAGLSYTTADSWRTTEDRLSDLEADVEGLAYKVDSLERENQSWGIYYLKSGGDEFGGDAGDRTSFWIDAYMDVDDRSDCTFSKSPISEPKFVLHTETTNGVILPSSIVPYTLIDVEWVGAAGDRNCVWTYFVPSAPESTEYRLETYIRHLRTGGGYGWSWSEDDLGEYRTIGLIIE